MLEPLSLPLAKPQFFINSSVAEKYLTMLASDGSSQTPLAGIISADDIKVSMPVGMHLWKGKLFEDVILSAEKILTNPKYVFDLETIPFKKKTDSSEAILLTLPWHHNFFHWMVEILPRLLLLDLAEDIQGLPLIVSQSAPGFVRESLNLAGYIDQVSFLEAGVYKFKRLHIPTRLAESGDVSPLAIEWLNRKLTKPDLEAPRNRRIYVSRADAKLRYVINEVDVQNLLSGFGFETVEMSRYSLAEQIQIFQQAEVVVGSHGAAFAHIAFMNPGAVFIEFFESGHFHHCFYRMANLKQLKYGFLVGQKQGLGFSVDLVQLKTLLEQALDQTSSLVAILQPSMNQI
ncbi:MAG: glycosyltransferase family 61 protein [Oscillatoriales cyanobacterium RM2_1_1]|nr:glycosyltransferase family 61 protein [Oscillatoriales cyanobacterium SM2_3_0]NJO47888.1 glycosyltransferase family 61 protein [Oscillatoriales cyanobacterium RM2_1_1]